MIQKVGEKVGTSLQGWKKIWGKYSGVQQNVAKVSRGGNCPGLGLHLKLGLVLHSFLSYVEFFLYEF